MVNKILLVVLLLHTRTRECENGAMADALDYIVPSSKTLEGVNKSLKENIYSGLSIRPAIVLVQMFEAYRKSQKFKADTVGKVDDAKDEVVDTAEDAKKEVEEVGKKAKNLFNGK